MLSAQVIFVNICMKKMYLFDFLILFCSSFISCSNFDIL